MQIGKSYMLIFFQGINVKKVLFAKFLSTSLDLHVPLQGCRNKEGDLLIPNRFPVRFHVSLLSLSP